ncbi:MAG: hypothetical protein HQL51_07835 [Magnetococcales bacterium]|nr:hypothetical protein [Magnetococcales bacterium]
MNIASASAYLINRAITTATNLQHHADQRPEGEFQAVAESAQSPQAAPGKRSRREEGKAAAAGQASVRVSISEAGRRMLASMAAAGSA